MEGVGERQDRLRATPGRFALQVSAAGEIVACEPRLLPELTPYGTLDNLDLRSLRSRPRDPEERQRLLSCNRCLFPCVAYMADHLLPQPFRVALSPHFAPGRKP